MNTWWSFLSCSVIQRPDWLWPPPSLILNVCRGRFSRVKGGRSANLTTHLYLMLKLRMRKYVPQHHIPSWRAQEQLYSALLLNLSMYFFLLLFFVRYLDFSGSKVLSSALGVWYTLGYSYCVTGTGCSDRRFSLALGGTKFTDIFACSA